MIIIIRFLILKIRILWIQKASEKTYEKDNRKKEYSTEIKKVSRKLKKGFEAADMHVDIII